MPQDKLSPRQDVLRYGEQNFLISPFVIKKGANRKLVILTLPRKMYVQFNFLQLEPIPQTQIIAGNNVA